MAEEEQERPPFDPSLYTSEELETLQAAIGAEHRQGTIRGSVLVLDNQANQT
jgi:hypothetical protein